MIKEYTNSDFNLCCELYIKVFNSPPWNDKWTMGTIGVYLHELIDNKRFFGFTLWDESILTGAIFCHGKSWYKGDEAYIDELFVASELQRKGRGKTLMDCVEKFAKDNNYASITLLTGRENPSYDFFVKYGYKQLNYMAFMHKQIE